MGEERQGMPIMFHMMNEERQGVGMMGAYPLQARLISMPLITLNRGFRERTS
jgi:hypothetical protein